MLAGYVSMKITSELLMLAPAVTFVCLLLCVRRFDSINKYVLTAIVGMGVAFAAMFLGIYLRLAWSLE